MRQKIQNFFLISFLLLGGTLFLSINLIDSDNIAQIQTTDQPKGATYWTADFIHIGANWSATNTTYPWCSGAGTYSDPYVIQNVTINGQNVAECIQITGGTVGMYFTIKNCILYNAQDEYSAALLSYIENGLYLNNTIYNNKGMGIEVTGDNSTIIKNKVYSNQAGGISCMINEKNNISQNEVYDNGGSGIYLVVNDNSTVINNTAYNNKFSGIQLLGGEFNNVTNNTCSNNEKYGVELVGGVSNSTITNNTLYKNKKGCVYEQFPDKDNTIDNNTCIPYIAQEDNGSPDDEPVIPFVNPLLIYLLIGIISAILIIKNRRIINN